MTECKCAETSVLREHNLRIPALHSCAYVRRRNELVAFAVDAATAAALSIQDKDEKEEKSKRISAWSRVYTASMQRLVNEAYAAGTL